MRKMSNAPASTASAAPSGLSKLPTAASEARSMPNSTTRCRPRLARRMRSPAMSSSPSVLAQRACQADPADAGRPLSSRRSTSSVDILANCW